MCRVAQHDHISSREHCPNFGIAHLCVLETIVIHVRGSSFAAPDTDHSAQVLSHTISSTSPIIPTVSPLHTGPVILDPNIPCDVPQQSGGSTQIPISHNQDKCAEERKRRGAPVTCGPNDFKCRKRSVFTAQNHDQQLGERSQMLQELGEDAQPTGCKEKRREWAKHLAQQLRRTNSGGMGS